MFKHWWKATYIFLDPNGSEQRGKTEVCGWSSESAMDTLIYRFGELGLEIVQVTVCRKRKLLSLFSEINVCITDSWSKANT